MVSSLMACRIRLTWPTLVTPRSLRSRLVNVNSSRPRTSWPWNASVYSDSCKESNQAHTSATPQLATSRPAPLAFSLRSFQKIPRPPRPPFRSWNKVYCIFLFIISVKVLDNFSLFIFYTKYISNLKKMNFIKLKKAYLFVFYEKTGQTTN